MSMLCHKVLLSIRIKGVFPVFKAVERTILGLVLLFVVDETISTLSSHGYPRNDRLGQERRILRALKSIELELMISQCWVVVCGHRGDIQPLFKTDKQTQIVISSIQP